LPIAIETVSSKASERRKTEIQTYISRFYFTTKEARRLHHLKMPDGSSLGEALQVLLQEKASEAELCTSHHLYPLVIRALDQPKTSFKEKAKRKWIKERIKELAKEN